MPAFGVSTTAISLAHVTDSFLLLSSLPTALPGSGAGFSLAGELLFSELSCNLRENINELKF